VPGFGTLGPVSTAPPAAGDFRLDRPVGQHRRAKTVPEASDERPVARGSAPANLSTVLDDAIVRAIQGGGIQGFSPPRWQAGSARRQGGPEVTVTVGSVKERELPEADDEFALLASEFDTIDELRANLADQVRGAKRVQQGGGDSHRPRWRALLDQVDMAACREAIVAGPKWTTHRAPARCMASSTTKPSWPKHSENRARRAKSSMPTPAFERRAGHQDAVAAGTRWGDDLDIQVGQERPSPNGLWSPRGSYGHWEPQQLLGYLQQNNQLPAMFADVRPWG